MKDGIGGNKPENHQEVRPQVPEYKEASVKKNTAKKTKFKKKQSKQELPRVRPC